jgi:hypothetical protein
MQADRRIHHPLMRMLLTTVVLSMGLATTSVLSGCDRRIGEDERLTPVQPRPDSRPDQPTR